MPYLEAIMNNPLSRPSPEAMTRQRAVDLCAQMQAISRNSQSLADSQQALGQLAGAIEQGWTPFLHDFTQRQRGSGAGLFSEKAAHAPLFKMLMDEFPCSEDYFPLLEDSELRRLVDMRPMSSPTQDVFTSWQSLGSPQRALLVERDSLAPSIPATVATVDGVFWWLHAMSKALWTPFREREFGEMPFHGFLESTRWRLLVESKPALANTLAIYLYCLSAAAALAKPEDRGALAWMRAAGSAMAPGSSHISAIPRLRMVASWTLVEAVQMDHAEIFMHLVRHLHIDPVEQEKAIFAQMPSTPEECLRHSSLSITEFKGIHKSSAKASSQGGSSLAKTIADFNQRTSGYYASASTPPKEFAPLFSACAQLGAEACWDALCLAFPPPLSLKASPTQTVMVSNMAHIERHRLLCERRSLESGACASSKKAMAENLERRAEHARKTISILPFSDEARLALLAGDPIAQADGHNRSLEAARLFDAQDVAEFESINGPALLRALSGKQTALAVVARYPWCAHMLARGADAEFLKAKLPIGSLSAAGDFFTAARLERYLLSLIGASGMAAIEQDALALAIGEQAPSIASSRKPRL